MLVRPLIHQSHLMLVQAVLQPVIKLQRKIKKVIHAKFALAHSFLLFILCLSLTPFALFAFVYHAEQPPAALAGAKPPTEDDPTACESIIGTWI